MKSALSLFGYVLPLVLLAACGVTPPEIATMTVSAWTPTPLPSSPIPPTSTSTPLPVESTATITNDPFGLRPDQACTPNQKLLYLEDFQDQSAPGWDEINESIRGWSMEPAPDQPGNIVAAARYADIVGDQPVSSRLLNSQFENAVWRVRFMYSKPFTSEENWFALNWKKNLEPLEVNGQQVFDSRYQTVMGINFMALRRLQQPVTNVNIKHMRGEPKAGVWHLAEIASFEGETGLWLNGARLFMYEDPEPLPPGTIGFELWLKGSDIVVYFDNISVCELSAPFESIMP